MVENLLEDRRRTKTSRWALQDKGRALEDKGKGQRTRRGAYKSTRGEHHVAF